MSNKGFANPAVPLQARRCSGQHEFRINVKFVAKFGLPLLRELRRAQDGEALNLAAVQQLTRNKTGFDGLSDTNVVGNQQANRIKL